MAKSKNIINLEMTRGDSKYIAINLQNVVEQDLDTAYFTCRVEADSDTYVFQKTLEDGITKVANAKYRIRIAPEDTEDLELGTYYYDIEIGANDDIYTPAKGKLQITYDVTRESENG